MLTMTQIKRIKKIYYSKGKNINEIAKITGHNYRTIVKYLEKDDFNRDAEMKKEEKQKYIKMMEDISLLTIQEEKPK